MTKRFIGRVSASAGILLALTACTEFEGVDYLRYGHPADPVARAGKQESASRALTPEIISVEPDVKPSAPAKQGSGTPPIDHSMHGGGR